jgi:hypothetical protein
MDQPSTTLAAVIGELVWKQGVDRDGRRVVRDARRLLDDPNCIDDDVGSLEGGATRAGVQDVDAVDELISPLGDEGGRQS